MANVFADDYLAKLIFLEKAVGHKVSYRTLDSFHIYTKGSSVYVEIQNAAKRIAEFVGLQGLTFLIEPRNLSKGTCGRIELNANSLEVFIQISPDLFDFPEAILATLSHEISHKFLHINGLSWGGNIADHYHNEVLTDITAVFLGLGKLMLNGCHVERVVANGEDRTRHVRNVGYLESDQLAFVYLLVSRMRRIPHDQMMTGLNSLCVYPVSRTSKTFAHYLRQELHSHDNNQSLRRHVMQQIETMSGQSKEFIEKLQRLRRKLDSAEKTISQAFETKCSEALSEIKEFDASLDPCLTYLLALRMEQASLAVLPEIYSSSNEIVTAVREIEIKERKGESDKDNNSSESLIGRISALFSRKR